MIIPNDIKYTIIRELSSEYRDLPKYKINTENMSQIDQINNSYYKGYTLGLQKAIEIISDWNHPRKGRSRMKVA